MTTNIENKKPIILLGAGFNADVRSKVSPTEEYVKENFSAYPLMKDACLVCGYDSASNLEQRLA